MIGPGSDKKIKRHKHHHYISRERWLWLKSWQNENHPSRSGDGPDHGHWVRETKDWPPHEIAKTPVWEITEFKLQSCCWKGTSIWIYFCRPLICLWQCWLPTWSPFFASYLSFLNTGWLRTLRFLSLLTQGNEMNGMNVWCAVFQFVYIFPWPYQYRL